MACSSNCYSEGRQTERKTLRRQSGMERWSTRHRACRGHTERRGHCRSIESRWAGLTPTKHQVQLGQAPSRRRGLQLAPQARCVVTVVVSTSHKRVGSVSVRYRQSSRGESLPARLTAAGARIAPRFGACSPAPRQRGAAGLPLWHSTYGTYTSSLALVTTCPQY